MKLLTAFLGLTVALMLTFDIWHQINDRKWKRGAEGIITQHAEHINRGSSNNAVVLYFLNGGTNMAGKTVAWEYLTFVKSSNTSVTNAASDTYRNTHPYLVGFDYPPLTNKENWKIFWDRLNEDATGRFVELNVSTNK